MQNNYCYFNIYLHISAYACRDSIVIDDSINTRKKKHFAAKNDWEASSPIREPAAHMLTPYDGITLDIARVLENTRWIQDEDRCPRPKL